MKDFTKTTWCQPLDGYTDPATGKTHKLDMRTIIDINGFAQVTFCVMRNNEKEPLYRSACIKSAYRYFLMAK